MKVSDLSAGTRQVSLELEILEMDNIRKFDRLGRQGRVCNALAKDDSGKVRLTLWDNQIDLCNVGDRVVLTDGTVSEWHGSLQVATGKKGKLTKA